MHKNLHKAGFGYIWLLMRAVKIMNFTGYNMSYNGAAGKAFSAHMPIYIPFFGILYTGISCNRTLYILKGGYYVREAQS